MEELRSRFYMTEVLKRVETVPAFDEPADKLWLILDALKTVGPRFLVQRPHIISQVEPVSLEFQRHITAI